MCRFTRVVVRDGALCIFMSLDNCPTANSKKSRFYGQKGGWNKRLVRENSKKIDKKI